jgi:Uma2 family endonuclease
MTGFLSELDFHTEPFEWTLERYHEAIAAGILTEYDAVELIKGKLVKKTPISEDHAGVIEALVKYFITHFGFEYRYRSENPVPMMDNSEPEPDFVIAKNLPTGAKSRHPTPDEVYLIIEVAHSTIQYDRKVKGPIYAEAGIPEYWIINLKSRKIEVHLSPEREENVYQTILSYADGETFESPFAGTVVVADLLPITEEE